MPDKTAKTWFGCYDCAELPDDPSVEPSALRTFEALPAEFDEAGVPLAPCPVCGRLVPELPIQRSRRKAQREGRLGPKTEEGKRASAEAARRANWKHGRYSPRSLGPSIGDCQSPPDRCQDCPYLNASDPAASPCNGENVCLRDLLHDRRVLQAYRTGDHRFLRDVFGQAAAKALRVYDRLVDRLTRDDLVMDQPAFITTDPETGEQRAVVRREDHPLLKHLPKIAQQLGLDPAEHRLTARSAGDGAKTDAETAAARALAERDPFEVLDDPDVPDEQKARIREALNIQYKRLRERGFDG